MLTCGAAHAATFPDGFQEQVVFDGLTVPVAVRFAADGRVFVAEKSGLVKVFEGLDDDTPTVVADLRPAVHDYLDRGLLGLAVDPHFPIQPYVYVLYTYNFDALAPEAGMPRWPDSCPDPPGGTDDGCVVNGRLSRLQVAPDNTLVGDETVLVENRWCQQYPSHSMGDLVFDHHRALYVSAGDGASYTFVDYGQGGGGPGSPIPRNPCGDPPGGRGGFQSAPTAEGGSLRTQDLRTPGDPVAYNGSVLRIDPQTGAALPDNPLVGGDPGDDRVIAFGLRNPYRMALREEAHELWIGDVGSTDWEEINRIGDLDAPALHNFGWPCYEGPSRQHGFDTANLGICEALFADLSHPAEDPYFAYELFRQIDPEPEPFRCSRSGSSSVAGLAFYDADAYPESYQGALFFADYSRRCLFVIPPDASGDPDPSAVSTFADGASGPVDLQVGPDGRLYYVDVIGGRVLRIDYFDESQPPVAVATVDVTNGSLPLEIHLDAGDSDGVGLTYAWDLDGDGGYDDSTLLAPTHTFATAGEHPVRLRVTSAAGLSDTDELLITAGNRPPLPVILAPSPDLRWIVGEALTFRGRASDPEDGELPASALHWEILLYHCPGGPTDCHTHPIEELAGAAEGSFTAIDHEWFAYVEIILRAVDAGFADRPGGTLTGETRLALPPRTADVTFHTDPPGLELVLGGHRRHAPFTERLIAGATHTVGAPAPQDLLGVPQEFIAWSDGGEASHDIIAPLSDRSFRAWMGCRSCCPLPREDWVVADVSSEELNDTPSGAAVRAIDGELGTFWHSEYALTNPDPDHPHWITLDLGASTEVCGFGYSPRQSGSANGTIGAYEFAVSADGVDWVTVAPATPGEALVVDPDDRSERVIRFEPTTGRYVRLTALDEIEGHPWASAAELTVLGQPFDLPDCPDQDNDGFRVCADTCRPPEGEPCGDCDDTDNVRHARMTDVCDGLDNDCDAASDDGTAELWHGRPCDGPDADACAEGLYSCLAGQQLCSDDSADSPEICGNGNDDDCDGLSDTQDPDCVGGACPDVDADGWAVCLGSCAPVPGVPCGDCDDGDLAIHPAASETCEDGVDQNCDGVDAACAACTSLSTTTWSVTADSEELDSVPSGAAARAVDDDPATYWHTEWVATHADPTHPHWIRIDLGQDSDVCALGYLPRQTRNANGAFGAYTLELSLDGEIWTTVAPTVPGELLIDDPADRSERLLSFVPVRARHLRLTALGEVNGNPWSSAAEIRVLAAVPCADADGDGWAVCESGCLASPGVPCGDCDDDDPGAHPGAAELCDGRDNDCSSASPDGAAEPWQSSACDGPDGDACEEGQYACVNGLQNCSDTTGDLMETCDGLDNDCDPDTPDGADEPWSGTSCDGPDDDQCAEGVHACAGGLQICTDPAFDRREICGNGQDDDCDGRTDADDADCAAAACSDPDGDGYVVCSGECELGPFKFCGDCDETNASVHPGGVDACGDGVDQDCSGTDALCAGCEWLAAAGWSASASSEETQTAPSGPVAMAIDGEPSTFWHTEWLLVEPDPSHPHWIRIDMGRALQVCGFGYLPRQSGRPNGAIAGYTFEVSLDGGAWTTVAPEVPDDRLVEDPGDRGERVVHFDTIAARYLRLTALSESSDNPWTSAAEIRILGQSRPACPDADGDGWALCEGNCEESPGTPCGDCEDADAAVYPGAAETCDGRDNDCDAASEDGAAEDWLAQACDGPDDDACVEGTLVCLNGLQTCNDDTGDTTEICSNGDDDDCDGLTDADDDDCVCTWLSASQIQAVTVDSEESRSTPPGEGARAIDGDPLTFWHTEWMETDPDPGHPHWIRIDLGQVRDVCALGYLPRQTGSVNGTIAGYRVEASLDGQGWTLLAPVASGDALVTDPGDRSERVVAFAPTPARFVRLTALGEVAGNPWTTAAEIRLRAVLPGGDGATSEAAAPRSSGIRPKQDLEVSRD